MRIPFLTPKTRDYALEPLTVKDSPAVSAIHHEDFVRPWSDGEFASLLGQETVFGFAARETAVDSDAVLEWEGKGAVTRVRGGVNIIIRLVRAFGHPDLIARDGHGESGLQLPVGVGPACAGVCACRGCVDVDDAPRCAVRGAEDRRACEQC